MADRGITYDILLRMRDQVSGVSKTIDKELKVVKQSADQVVGSLNGISGRLSAVSNSSVGNVKNISNVVDNLKRQYQSLGKRRLRPLKHWKIPQKESLRDSIP